jgi:hypothetical protein
MSFLFRLREWGKDSLKRSSPKSALEELHTRRKKSSVEIGGLFQMDSRAVRFWIDALGVETTEFTPRIMSAARKKKFSTLADYFRSRWKLGFQQMSDELKVSRTTVESYYKVFTEELEKEGANV